MKLAPAFQPGVATLRERFESKVERLTTQCWRWVGSVSKSGYGEIVYPKTGRLVRATHVALHLFKGEEIVSGQCALHSCDNRWCVNPKHLRYGTRAENMQDAVARGRNARGEASGKSKLTEVQVRKIRKLARKGTLTVSAIARMFGVSPANATAVIRGITWKHVH